MAQVQAVASISGWSTINTVARGVVRQRPTRAPQIPTEEPFQERLKVTTCTFKTPPPAVVMLVSTKAQPLINLPSSPVDFAPSDLRMSISAFFGLAKETPTLTAHFGIRQTAAVGFKPVLTSIALPFGNTRISPCRNLVMSEVCNSASDL